MQFRHVFYAARLGAVMFMVVALLAAGVTPTAYAQDDVEETNKAILSRFIEEANSGVIPDAEEYYALGFTLHNTEGTQTYDTVEALDGFLSESLADVAVTIDDLMADGDRVTARYTASFNDGGFEAAGISIFRLVDGKIVEEWAAFDVLGLLTQMGMLPEMGPGMGEEMAEPVSIATGFTSPQGVLVDPDGNVWVVDGGTGGDTDVEWHSPESGEIEPGKMGETARVVRIDANGEETVAAMLPSISIGTDFIGGARLALLDGELYATVGQWLGELGDDRLPLEGVVAHINADGTVEEAGVTWDVEIENPDGHVVDTHPYGLTAGPDGRLWVADAGGNTLIAVDTATGEVTLEAVFDGIPGPLPNPFRGGEMEMDPVPTGVAFDDAGTAYVSLLTGFPFVPGTASVKTVDADGNIADYATGLTMLTDLRRGPDGNFYAVQFGQFTDQGPTPNSGAIVRVMEGDASEIVLDGLSFPTSVDFNADGDAYIAINGVGPPGSGELLMVAGLTGRAGTPVAEAMAAAAEAGPGIPEGAVGPAVPEDPGYLIDDMGDGLYVVSDGLYQAMFLTTGEGVIVVDAPPNLGQKLVDAIAATTDEPVTHVVYSHGHADHIGAAGLLPADAVYIAHEDTAAQLERNGAGSTERMPPFGVFLGAAPVPLPTQTFADDYTLAVGDQVLELAYLGPNHSPGNSYVYAPKQRVLMLVDIVFPGWAPFKELALAEDIPGYIGAHDEVLAYDFDTFVGGHLTRLGTREDVEMQRDFVQDLTANAAEALQTVDVNAVMMETGMEHGFADVWVLFGAYLGEVADVCAELTLAGWGDKLGGAETVMKSHCETVIDSLRLE